MLDAQGWHRPDATASLAAELAIPRQTYVHRIAGLAGWNHNVLVSGARKTGKSIRERARLRKPQRVTLSSWAFAQLGSFIGYKALRAGVPAVYVDPAWTSRTCADCGHADKRNRVSQARFTCRGCGVVAHADRNASRNIAARGQVAWDAGRESRAPAPSCDRQGLDAAASITASDALAASSVPSGPSKLTQMSRRRGKLPGTAG